MPSTEMGKAARAAAVEDSPPVPEGPLEDIFVRLDAADLARLSAACTSFHGAITDPAFRRRFARLHHPPPLVGFLELQGTAAPHARTLHHASTPAARAVTGATDFACSFLPDPGSWWIRDASGGHLLLSPLAAAGDLPDLMVCDPLHRTFLRLPSVPDHLTAATGRHVPGIGWFPFLVPLPAPLPASEENTKEPPPLQVVWMLQRGNAMIAFVFSSSTWEWRQVPTFWRGRKYHVYSSYCLYAHGCFYWTSWHFPSHHALKLDMREMEFSTMPLPSVTEPLGMTNLIVEASGGNLGALVLGDDSLDLYCRNGVGAGADWCHSRTVPLPSDSLEYRIIGAADGYLLLEAHPPLYFEFDRQTQAEQEARYFSVKLKTLVFEELRVPFNEELVFVHLYTSFPPLLSLPSVCNEKKTGQDQGVTGEASAGVTGEASAT